MMHNPWNRVAYSTQGAVSGFGIDVRDFGSIAGDNFRDTLERALWSAYIETGAPDDGGSGAISVVVPSGRYEMGDTTLNFRGSYPKYTPGLVGLGGVGSVVLIWQNTIKGPWISTGTESPELGVNAATYNQVFQNIELRPHGGVSAYGGIKSRFGIMQRFTDVLVRGLATSDQPWDAGTAFDLRSPSYGNANHQHLRLERCYSHFCQIGYWFGEATWACTALDVHANASMLAGAIYEGGSVVTWTGGNTQSGPGDPNWHHWNAGTKQAVHCSGAMRTDGLPSGAGAWMESPVGQFTRVRGLSGLTGYRSGHSSTHKGLWFEARRMAAPFTNNDRLSGLYRIHEVISDSECIIRKASNPQPNEPITWQVRGGGGAINTAHSGIYHEGGTYTMWSLGPDLSGSSRVKIFSNEANNAESVVEATGVTGRIHVETTTASGGKDCVLRRVNSYLTDQRVTSVDMDSYSRHGVQAAAVGGSERRPAGVWDSTPRAPRYNAALRERGFVFAFDARKPGSDFLGGIHGTYVGLEEPVIDPVFQRPMQYAESAEWDITSLFEAGKVIEPTVIMIGRLPDTEPSTTNRMLRLQGGPDFSLDLHWNDQAFAGAGSCVGVYSTGLGTYSTPLLFPVDTKPHVMVATAHCGGNVAAGGGSDVVSFAPAVTSYGYAPLGFVGGQSCKLQLGQGADGQLIAVHIAVAPFGITDEERAYFIELARSEWNIEE